MNSRYYAGIGSRTTPADVLTTMQRIASRMANAGWTLRSGGAQGADTAFQQGCTAVNGWMQIFLPWPGFNGIPATAGIYPFVDEAALQLAAQFHPNWAACSAGARKLHARNCYQILGPNLATPVDLVLCWTPHGSGSGGTGQALRIAHHHGIPVHDLGHPTILHQYREALES